MVQGILRKRHCTLTIMGLEILVQILLDHWWEGQRNEIRNLYSFSEESVDYIYIYMCFFRQPCKL